MQHATKKKTATKKKKGAKKKKHAIVPFLPYHIAAIAWIFFPGGNVPANTKAVPNLDAEIQRQVPTMAARTRVTKQLNAVFGELQTYIGTPAQNTRFVNGRAAFLALLSDMSNLWDGDDSQVTAALVAQIAAIS
jgi:hypothetical protein